jgi:predicted flap endonuclease-1-like 5' DNA nuclease
MSELTAELLLWILLVFFIGCILGYVLHVALASARRRLAPPPSQDPSAADRKPEAAKIAQLKVPMVAARTDTSPGNGKSPGPHAAARRAKLENTSAAQPKGLPAPRGGSPDALQRISGVGPKIEVRLHELGIFHFDQIADWSEKQMQWVDNHLKFKGRIGRDEWVKQARLLAQGKDEEFSGLYGNGHKKSSRAGAPERLSVKRDRKPRLQP